MSNERIEQLRASFPLHDAAVFMQATLEELEVGRAVVRMPAREELMMNADMAPGRIMQGGFFAGVLPDFACVYAAMTLSEGHTVLVGLDVRLKNKVLETEMIVARAKATRIDERNIEVVCDVSNTEGELKATGKLWFREARRKQ